RKLSAASQWMARSSKLKRGTRSSFLVIMNSPRAIANVVKECAQNTSQQYKVAQPLQRPFPEPYGPGNMRVSWQPIGFWTVGVSENVNHISPSHTRRIVNAGLLKSIPAQLLCPSFGLVEHVFATTKAQAVGRTGLDASGFQAYRSPV